MADDPVRILADLLGDLAARVSDYGAVWQDAARKNASGEYDADGVIADALKIGGLMTRDAFTLGTGALQALGAIRDQPRPD
jgi:hypothetical protein